jgi:hypothetical protein
LKAEFHSLFIGKLGNSWVKELVDIPGVQIRCLNLLFFLLMNYCLLRGGVFEEH